MNASPPLPRMSPAFRERYALQDVLGEGGSGVVFLANQIALGRQVAVKLLKPGDDDDLERFRREAALLAEINHPGVLKILDYGDDEGRPFLVTELVKGGTALDRLQARPFEWGETVELITQLAHILGHVHARGLIHRDIKPANVFLTDEGPKLADFGMARSLTPGGTITRAGEILGTPHYLSPEQVEGKPLDPRSDQYELGVMAFQLLTDSFPFPDGTQAEVAAARLLQPPADLRARAPDVPAPVAAAVARMLARNPGDRFPGMNEVARAFARTVAPRPAKDPAPSIGPTPDAPPILVFSWRKAVGIALAIGAVGGAAAWYSRAKPTLERVAPPSSASVTPAIEKAEYIPLKDMYVAPTEASVLVAGIQRGNVPLTIQLFRGRETIGTPSTSSDTHFRHVFVGLAPDTEYEISVRGPAGQPGVGGLPFRTLEASARNRYERILDTLRTQMIDLSHPALHGSFDHRLVPALVAAIRRARGQIQALRQVSWIARDVRSREVLDLVVEQIWSQGSPEELGHAADAAAHTGHPRARALTRRSMEANPGWNRTQRMLECLELVGDASDAEWAMSHASDWKYAEPDQLARTMAAMDPARAPERFRAWIEQGPERLTAAGFIGLAWLAAPEAVPTLGKYAAQPGWTRLCGHLLRQLNTPASRDRLLEVWRALPPRRVALAIPAAMADLPVVTDVAALATECPDPPQRRVAVVALGLSGKPEAAEAIQASLVDRDPGVVEAAVWALGSLAAVDAATTARLEERIAQGKDLSGVAAWAIARSGRREALEALRRRLDHCLARLPLDEDPGLGALAWAVSRLDPERAPALAQRIRDAGRQAPREYAVACVRAGAEVSHPDRRTELVFPIGYYFRTGLSVEPGDALRITSESRMGQLVPRPGLPDTLEQTTAHQPGVDLNLGVTLRSGTWQRLIQKTVTLLPAHTGEITLSPYGVPDLPVEGVPPFIYRGSALVKVERSR